MKRVFFDVDGLLEYPGIGRTIHVLQRNFGSHPFPQQLSRNAGIAFWSFSEDWNVYEKALNSSWFPSNVSRSERDAWNDITAHYPKITVDRYWKLKELMREMHRPDQFPYDYHKEPRARHEVINEWEKFQKRDLGMELELGSDELIERGRIWLDTEAKYRINLKCPALFGNEAILIESDGTTITRDEEGISEFYRPEGIAEGHKELAQRTGFALLLVPEYGLNSPEARSLYNRLGIRTPNGELMVRGTAALSEQIAFDLITWDGNPMIRDLSMEMGMLPEGKPSP